MYKIQLYNHLRSSIRDVLQAEGKVFIHFAFLYKFPDIGG